MEIEVKRKFFTEESTVGDFFIDGCFYYFSLEDTDRQMKGEGLIIPWEKKLKVYGKTAIPYGRYEVVVNYSNRFKRLMPLLLNVPDYEGIRIHNGNTAEDTEGCILIGHTKSKDFIGNSKSAFNGFMNLLTSTLKREKVWLSITGQMIGG